MSWGLGLSECVQTHERLCPLIGENTDWARSDPVPFFCVPGAAAVVEASLGRSAFLGFEGITSGQTYVSNVAAVQLMRRSEPATICR